MAALPRSKMIRLGFETCLKPRLPIELELSMVLPESRFSNIAPSARGTPWVYDWEIISHRCLIFYSPLNLNVHAYVLSGWYAFWRNYWGKHYLSPCRKSTRFGIGPKNWDWSSPRQPLKTYICVAAANSLTRKDHDPVTGEPSKLLRPVCICKESEWRPVRTPVSVPVWDPVRLWRSSSSGCLLNTISRLGRLDLLHPKVVDLAPPYSQCNGHTIWHTNTRKTNHSLARCLVRVFQWANLTRWYRLQQGITKTQWVNFRNYRGAQ